MTWYAARAGGVLAYLLLTTSVLLGLVMSGRHRLGPAWPRFAVEDVHGFAGTLTGVFIVVHGGALLLDDWLPFTVADLLVPGSAPYRPLATAAGVVGAELLAAVAISNRLRRRIGHRHWRRMHYLTFLVWLLALIHGITAGTDSDTLWATALYSASAGAVGALLAYRVLNTRAPRAGMPAAQ